MQLSVLLPVWHHIQRYVISDCEMLISGYPCFRKNSTISLFLILFLGPSSSSFTGISEKSSKASGQNGTKSSLDHQKSIRLFRKFNISLSCCS